MERTYTQVDGSTWLDKIEYDNGLGESLQEVSVGVTPDHQDLVILKEYDDYRRPLRTWLPAKSNGGQMNTAETLKISAKALANDDKPYVFYSYKGQNPDFMAKEWRPGRVWEQNNKCIEKNVYVENSSVNRLRVLNFMTLAGKDVFNTGATYNSKIINSVVDEDGVESLEFKDKDGNVVVKRTIRNNEVYTTYFVYDDRGQLLFVLPPELASYYESNNTYMQRLSPDDSMMYKFGYEYRYDGRKNCIYKKFPGCAPVYYIYDKAGHCIFSQNGVQRTKGEWSYKIPDVFGRTVMTGVCNNSFMYAAEPLKNVVVKAVRDNSASNGYSISGITLIGACLYTLHFYDNYNFLGSYGFPAELTYSAPPSADYGIQGMMPKKGLSTGSKMARMTATGISGYDYMATYYDDQGRIIQTRKTNCRGGYDNFFTSYDFSGNILKECHVHKVGSSSTTEFITNTYDHVGRLLTRKHRYNNGSEVTLASITYDELGRLKEKHSGVLSSSYTYNVRSWLKSITTGNLFSETLYYNESHDGNTPCYGGNVSAMEWKADSKTRGYVFSYDGLSRLTQASYSENAVGNGHYNTEYTYDKMGNILALKRYGLRDNNGYGLIDNLTYTYNGNQVVKVDDAVSGPYYNNAFHFVDGVDSEIEYTYDQNGNMTKDLNKGILSIQYNLLNLPSKIIYQNGRMAEYVYSADGVKLSTTYTNGPAVTSSTYCGSMVYEDGTLKQVLVDGGYITFNGSTPQYHFYLKDHLGNNRVVLNAGGAIEQVSHYYPYGGLFGESTNGDVQRYKYNGKELDRMNGLDWYDYGARRMDGIRFTTIDPLAEKYYSVSPYAYCAGNPIRFIDKDGKEIWINYLDSNGKLQSFQYSVGMICDVDNNIAQSLVANLNTMYLNEAGKEVMDAILTSETKFRYSQTDTHSEGGEGYFDPLTNTVNLDNANNTLAFAEETFHLYQRINGQGGTTDVNEVEAKLFSSKLNYEINSWNDSSYLNNLSGVPGSSYTDNMNELFWGGYNDIDYKSAINNFFSGSNSGYIYKNLPGYRHGTVQKNPLIKKFLPVK